MRATRFVSWVWKTPAARAVALANLVPLAGAFWFDWDAFDIVFLYWLENLVIGFFNALKIPFARGGFQSYSETYRRYPGTLIMVPFFILHYGFFCYVHGSLLFHLFGREVEIREGLLAAVSAELSPGMILPLAALFIEHAYAFYKDFWVGGAYARNSPTLYFLAPYGRVILVHLALLGGGLLALYWSSPLGLLVLLVALKVGPELVAVRIAGRGGLPSVRHEEGQGRANRA